MEGMEYGIARFVGFGGRIRSAFPGCYSSLVSIAVLVNHTIILLFIPRLCK